MDYILVALIAFQAGFWITFALAAHYWPRDRNGVRL
jgi:hypothetical protein